jgi:hypothetical protein
MGENIENLFILDQEQMTSAYTAQLGATLRGPAMLPSDVESVEVAIVQTSILIIATENICRNAQTAMEITK